MTDFPWYEEVAPDEPLLQGDLVENCPVLVFAELPKLEEVADTAALLKVLQTSAAIQQVRTIVMTQACDLAQGHVRNIILCPIYHLSEYRKQWEPKQKELGQNPTEKSWNRHTKEMSEGKIWNLTMLEQSKDDKMNVSIEHQVVDFHEVFSLPVEFLTLWVRTAALPRLRLRPPYREHLSQSFARFFMRVGLPQNIKLGG